MTKLLDEAIEKARSLPDPRQDEAAEILLTMVAQSDPDAPQLTDEQAAEVRRRRGDRVHAMDEEGRFP